MNEAKSKAAAFDQRFKKLSTDIDTWDAQLKKAKSDRVKKDLQAKLDKAKKQKG